MLLWRIGVDVLPAKENMQRRMEINNPSCALCRQEVESNCHLFLNFSVAKALWYTCCWGFKAMHGISNCEDIIKMILDPPEASCPKEDQWMINLNMAIILDEIWYLKNQVLFQNIGLFIVTSIRRVQHKLAEYTSTLANENAPSCPKPASLGMLTLSLLIPSPL